MSYIHNDPAEFAAEAAAGFVAANRATVRAVPGGVARRAATPDGQVAVVVGGGSGHYPAFAGLVGPGLAHAAAMGGVFASPSAQDVLEVARSVATDAGVLLTYGNYAGDVLNFDEAERRLRADGVPCATVRVTDDIASASSDDRHRRRGIAGDLAVFRAAAWAAEQGMPLDAVAALATRANERTRTLGVAFSGATLPGADAPLFTIPAGRMGIGMGIHGEPGLREAPMATADDLAELLVSALLDERPADVPPPGAEHRARVAVIVNGLGAVKSEELFVLFGAAAARLGAAGIEIVEPEVGEFATSFEMAGVSLTLLWLDDELEAAWRSPAAAPGYRKGAVPAVDTDDLADAGDAPASHAPELRAVDDPASAAAGRTAADVIRAVRDVIDREVDELGRLDAIAGDGDHGIGMQRGSRAAADAADRAAAAGTSAGLVLAAAGYAWAHRAGGTSGALWGAALRAAGEHLGDAAPDAAAASAAVREALDAVQRMGGAQLGDRTLVDALSPFADELAAGVDAGLRLRDAWRVAASVAHVAALTTAGLQPRLGRARSHGDAAVGSPDAGAVSLALAVTAMGRALDQQNTEQKEHA
jgi:D-erythrulose 4-kinase